MQFHKYRDYGNDDPRESDPWAYCAVKDSLYKGNQQYGPLSQGCRGYLSDRCSQGWDEICEYSLKNTDTHVPDDYMDNLPEGLKLLRMIGEKRFCRLVTDQSKGKCAMQEEKVDPIIPNSPSYVKYSGGGCKLVCNLPAKNGDLVLDKLLEHPKEMSYLLNAMCRSNKIEHEGLKQYCQHGVPTVQSMMTSEETKRTGVVLLIVALLLGVFILAYLSVRNRHRRD